ncbi:MAG TPA: TlpA disulfide reductase family protein, partial [Pirellulales bacterium]|nr:TlpA disulfide reductase family protein [Pirellulales bacterium]
WCGPCVAEVPNVKSLYAKYHDRGFDVVGISLDRDRAALDKFLVEKEIPWTTLHEAGGTHPAATHYGVNAIPTMLLVGRDGKVVSIRARGEELTRLLADLIGPAEAAEKPE